MHSSDTGRIHIVGAGLAGLAAAVRLVGAGRAVTVHEATAQAGGRCRSYYDQTTGMVIDNGTHLLLSGNHAVLSYVETIGSSSGLRGPKEAEFSFFDLASGERWTLRFGESRFPWWVFDKERRVPKTAVVDYLPLARLAWTSADKPIGQVMTCDGPLYDRLLEPLARRFEYLPEGRLGEAGGSPYPRNACVGRPGVSSVACPRWSRIGIRRARAALFAGEGRHRCV